MNLKELKEPFVIFLVGVPLVGKSTFIRENFEGINVYPEMRYLWKLLVQEIIPKRGKCRPKICGFYFI
jgi:hypothetical protein